MRCITQRIIKKSGNLGGKMAESVRRMTILHKLFIILIVLTSGTDIAFDSSIPMYLLFLTYILLISTKQISLKHCNIAVIAIFLFFVIWIIQVIVNGGDLASMITVLKYTATIFMVFSFVLSRPDLREDYFEYLIKCLFAFAIISTILFALIIVGIQLPTIKTSSHNTTTVYYLEHYSHNPFYGLFGFRNAGIYWEPGMYQIYLNLLIVYALQKKEWSFAKKILVTGFLILLVLTTGSVSGYLLTVALLVVNAVKNNNRIYIKIFVILFTVVALYYAFPYLENMINNKLTIGKSYDYRVSDIVNGFSLFKTKPIWGYGIVNKVYAQTIESTFGISRSGNSNGMMSILINFGLLGGAVYTFLFIWFFKYINSLMGKGSVLLMIFWLIISLNTEPISAHPFIYYIMSFGYAFYLEKKRTKISNNGLSNNKLAI